MSVSEAKKRANAKYTAKTYEQLPIRVPKGKKQIIKNFAEQQGKTLNGFINQLIDEALKK